MSNMNYLASNGVPAGGGAMNFGSGLGIIPPNFVRLGQAEQQPNPEAQAQADIAAAKEAADRAVAQEQAALEAAKRAMMSRVGMAAITGVVLISGYVLYKSMAR